MQHSPLKKYWPYTTSAIVIDIVLLWFVNNPIVRWVIILLSACIIVFFAYILVDLYRRSKSDHKLIRKEAGILAGSVVGMIGMSVIIVIVLTWPDSKSSKPKHAAEQISFGSIQGSQTPQPQPILQEKVKKRLPPQPILYAPDGTSQKLFEDDGTMKKYYDQKTGEIIIDGKPHPKPKPADNKPQPKPKPAGKPKHEKQEKKWKIELRLYDPSGEQLLERDEIIEVEHKILWSRAKEDPKSVQQIYNQIQNLVARELVKRQIDKKNVTIKLVEYESEIKTDNMQHILKTQYHTETIDPYNTIIYYKIQWEEK